MCLKAGVMLLSCSSFDPSMNCLSHLGTAKLSFKIGLSKHPRQTGTACPFELGGRAQEWLLSLGLSQIGLLLLDFACHVTQSSDFVLRVQMLARRVLRASEIKDQGCGRTGRHHHIHAASTENPIRVISTN